ncbi:S41 family peptidase [Vineibacter terrae]|uniref:S41 family peptidase n=1 Tax=Vineibacter terrae TaxID=2586908 RepID=A0A5C8PES2_9HYPH|nr:S41 family peptidase [Vineibacter terrae]TXL72106.1 S41 family peptidase [Vineibacter terrae]
MRFLRHPALAAALSLSLVAAPAIAWAQDKAPDKDKPKTDKSELYQQLNLFGDVLERIRNDYVEPPKETDLIEAAINGMLASLDPHSSYMNPKQFRDMQVQTRGEFGGLGIEVTMENGLVKVVAPIDDTPAAKAGLQSGDLIVSLDDQPVMGLTLQEAVEKMRGKVDTKIKIGVRRQGKDPFDVTLTRAIIKIQSVKARVEGGDIGYVRITSFTEQTASGLNAALEKFKKDLGPKWKGLVLDLRNNPGGLLDQSIAVSDAFLDKGEIVSIRARKPEDVQRWNAKPGDLTEGRPIVVLVNGGSASASEIVAGALQDHRRAIILGTRSFGKGSVQTIMPVTGGGAMRLTTALYFTPSGRSIQKEGIKPDIEVEQAKIEALKPGDRTREENLRGSIANPNGRKDGSKAPDAPKPEAKPDGTSPEAKDTPPQDPNEPAAQAANDYQLLRAMDLIRGINLFSQRSN